MAENDVKSWVNTTVGGYYLVERKLGDGGMGEVYLARDLRLDGKVVLKAPRPGMLLEDPDLEKRFRHEVRAIARLDHPHVVKVHNIFQCEDRPVAVMQYLEGGTLDDRTDIPLSCWLPQIADALDYIHGKDLVHRDVKPANILFDSHGNAYLSDFGVVKSTAAQTMMTMTGVSMGTPKYMSPEVIQAAPFDGRADQYALAIIVYEQLSGRMPFEAATPMHMFAAHLSQTPLPLCECDARFSRRLSDVLSRGMAKEPSARFGGCVEFSSAVLEALAGGQASPAVPPRRASSETPRSTATSQSTAFVPRPSVPPALPPTSRTKVEEPAEKEPRGPSPVWVYWHKTVETLGRAGSRLWEQVRRVPPRLAIAGGISLVLLLAAIIGLAYLPGWGDGGSIVTDNTDTIPPSAVPDALTTVSDSGANSGPSMTDEAPQRQATELGVTVDFTNSIGMKFKLIPAGEFMMGSPAEEKDHEDEEKQHLVRITKPFYLGVYEVTVGDFRKFVEATGYQTDAEKDGEGGWGWNESKEEIEGPDPKYDWCHPGYSQTESHPVVNVSWNDAVAFCEWLSKTEPGKHYRLPTEAEWEYACRAGTRTAYYHGDDPEGLARVGNVADGTAREKYSYWSAIHAKDGYVFTAPVGRFEANRFGLYDIHGNVWEWCMDWYDDGYYASSLVDDPGGPLGGSTRVNRGGCWYGYAGGCRSAKRSMSAPESRDNGIGFRVALVPADDSNEKAQSSATSDVPVSTPDSEADASPPVVKEAPQPQTTVFTTWPFDQSEAERQQQQTATELEVPADFTNSIGMKFKLIPAGEFIMGSPKDEKGHCDDERRHRVRITKPFYLAIHEVTVGDFRKFVDATEYETDAEKDGQGGYGWFALGQEFAGPDSAYTWRWTGWQQTESHPVVNVSWNDAVAFCEWLSKTEPGKHYRLPTEAEWEYACRAGTQTAYCCGEDPENLVNVGNVADGTAKEKLSDLTTIRAEDGYIFTAPVGCFASNNFGLYDMHGNVWEWCEDWYDADYYIRSPENDPSGPPTGSDRVQRGGGWSFLVSNCRSAARAGHTLEFRFCGLGFRPVLEPAAEGP